MSPGMLRSWAAAIGGFTLSSSTPTCTQSVPGTAIDFYIASQNVAIRTGAPRVVLNANITPHRPVSLDVKGKDAVLWVRVPRQPKSIPVVAPVGCARYPRQWTEFHQMIALATSGDDLAQCWDGLIDGTEQELLDRHDIMGPERRSFEGRSGKHITPVSSVLTAVLTGRPPPPPPPF